MSTSQAITKSETLAIEKKEPHPHLESAIRASTAHAIETCVKQEKEELLAIKKEQQKVRELQELLQRTKTAADDKSDLTLTDELKKLLERAKEAGAVIPEYPDDKLTPSQRIDLLDRLRVVIDTLNQNNDFRLQSIQRITNLFHQICSILRSVIDKHSSIVVGHARNMKTNGG